jgi:hypothetical protein
VESKRTSLSGPSSKRQWDADRLVRLAHGLIVLGTGLGTSVSDDKSASDSLNGVYDDDDFIVEEADVDF